MKLAEHAHSKHAVDSYFIENSLWTRGRNAIVFVALVAWIASIAGFIANPNRFFESYLFGYLFCITIPFGATFFVMIQYLTGSAWSVPMRRIAENVMATIPVGAILFIPVVLGVNHLYEWANSEWIHAEIAQQHGPGKTGYLNPQWFIIRAAIFFLLWTLWTSRIYSHSTRQDKDGSIEHMHSISRWSAPGLLMLMLSVTLAAFDWSMSLNPHWYSTIFGLYVFAGGGLAFIATWILICMALRAKGVLKNTINVEHYHDLGKWLFAMTVFWAYISFSQYLLIWYGNLPEETIWFKYRFEGSWVWWSWALLFGHFIIPFLVLVLRASKRNFRILTTMAIWILVAHFVDVYWQVMPTFYHAKGISFHWLDITCPVAIASVFALVFWMRVKSHALLPLGDPRFEQGLEFENA
jgi:hypothetical protein